MSREARARPRSDVHDKMGTIEQQADTSSARSEAHVLTALIAGYPAKPAALIDF